MTRSVVDEQRRKFIGTSMGVASSAAVAVASSGLLGCAQAQTQPAALNSGRYWTGFLKRPGTIVLEFLEPIAPGLKRDAFMSLLESRIETATHRLLS